MTSEPEQSPAKPLRETAPGKSILFAAGAVAATSAMLFWGTGLRPIWWLTWFAPLPVLLISLRLGRLGAFCVAALAWFLGSLNMWRYLLSAIALPFPLVLILSAAPACLFALAALLFRRFVLGGALWKAALAFPAFWVTCE